MIYDRLKGRKRLAMHMPGHKRNTAIAPYLSGLGADMDITEIDGFDDLHAPGGMIARCMERAAHLWGSRRAHLLINGSTCGILAAIRTMTHRGDKIILTRGAHKSVFHAIELCSLEPVFIMPPVLEDSGIFGSIEPQSVELLLEEHPDARLVIITSPTYEGVISDIAGICRAAHNRGVPVMVDEAHGAHLGFGGFPDGAVRGGADIVIQSLHKTLPSLTQTAMLHVGSDRVDLQRLAHQLSVFETSSPSYLLMASIDGCVDILERKPELLGQWRKRLDAFGEAVQPLEKLRICGYNQPLPVFAHDPSKLLISTGSADLDGYRLADILRDEYDIEPEYALPESVLCMTGPGDNDESLERLAQALLDIDRRCSAGQPGVEMTLSKLMMGTVLAVSPEEALEAQTEPVPVEQSEGRICGEYIWAYPPGIPLLIPGEMIDSRLQELILSKNCPELRSTYVKIPSYIYVLS